MLLEGLFLPLTTPFYPDGRLYLRKLEHNVERYSRTPAAGLALLTPTGEGALLSSLERLEVLRVALEAAGRAKVMLADCSLPSVTSTLEHLHAAHEMGYDAALLRYPAELQRLAPDDAGVRELWFRSLADRSPIPLVLAVVRSPGSRLSSELVGELARAEQVLGWVAIDNAQDRIADVVARTAGIAREVVVTPVFAAATRRMLQTVPASQPASNYVPAASLTAGALVLADVAPASTPVIRTRTRRVGFQILAGDTANVASALHAGARGALLPLAVCVPQAAYEVLAAWKDDDAALLEAKVARLTSAVRVEHELGCAAIKAGCDRNGYFGGRPRLPLPPLRADEQEEVEALLRGMRN